MSSHPQSPERTFLSPPELAEMLAVSEHTLSWWRKRREGPPPTKVGSLVRYRLTDVEKWLEERTRRP